MIGSQPFRELDNRSWEAARRIEDMDRDGVSVQVLSPMPELLSYWIDADGVEIICDHLNDQIAALVSGQPGRFAGLGAVPLQAPARAAEYLIRLKNDFGLAGVEIGSNVNGLMLGDPQFDPFWAAAEALDMPVFVHALHPVAMRSIEATPAFTAFAGFPIDVGMAAASMMMGGVTHRYPRLRIGFSHGGGALSAMLGRLDRGWEATEGFAIPGLARPSRQASQLFYDSNVYDPASLRHLVEVVAPGRVFAGTDYPYLIQQEQVGSFINQAGLTAAQIEDVRCRAAEQFFGGRV